jgi:hypothetical protein
MSNPLPDSTISTLQTCETAALAAAMIIAGSFPEILNFAARVSARRASDSVPEPTKPASARRNNEHDRREKPGQCDERLLKAMQARPGATIGALADAIGKSRTSTVTALHRLRDADLAESLNGVWSLNEPTAPKETPRWTAPVSAQRRNVETEEREHA